MSDTVSAARGVDKPRRPQASPLFRLVSDHLHRLQTVYDARFTREDGPWRPVVAQVDVTFLACGVLEHGVARIRCDACTPEILLAFACKCRYLCPSCRAKRLASGTQWLDPTLLAPVPHRQVVLTIPKRLRAYCLYRRRRLGEIARVAARTVTAAIRKRTGERARAVGIVACLQTHGSRANGHPHLPLRVTDGGFRPDGTCVSWPVPDTARLTEAFRRAGLRRCVRLERFDEEPAAGMLTGPHAGFHLHTAVWVPEEDRALATRLARYGAMRIVAFITQGSVIDQILTHRRARPAPVAHAGARSPPIDAGPFGVRAIPPACPMGPRRLRLPTLTEGPAALQVPERDPRHAAARHEALARSAIALHARRIVDPPRLQFLSRIPIPSATRTSPPAAQPASSAWTRTSRTSTSPTPPSTWCGAVTPSSTAWPRTSLSPASGASWPLGGRCTSRSRAPTRTGGSSCAGAERPSADARAG